MANPLVRLSRVTTQPMTSGFDLADLSGTVRPQDDLYQYVNSEWIERTAMPADKARYGTFDILADGAELAIRAILDEARTAPAACARSSIVSRRSMPCRRLTSCWPSSADFSAVALVAFTRSSLTTTR